MKRVGWDLTGLCCAGLDGIECVWDGVPSDGKVFGVGILVFWVCEVTVVVVGFSVKIVT